MIKTIREWSGPLLLAASILLIIPLGLRALQSSSIAAPTPSPSLPIPATNPITQSVGLNILYSETDPQTNVTGLWSAPVLNLSARQLIASFPHQEGYPPYGRVSPDGQRLAVNNNPPGTSEQTVRANGGQLWVLNTDGTGLQKIADEVGFLSAWTPDSRGLVYGRRVPLENPTQPEVPYRTDIYLYDLQQNKSTQMILDDSAYGIQPLGWSADGGQFYSASIDLKGKWTISTWERAAQKTTQQTAVNIPEGTKVRALSLSPDGKSILIEGYAQEDDVLDLLDLDSGTMQRVSKAPRASNQAYPSASALWTPGGHDLLVSQLPNHSQTVRAEMVTGTAVSASPLHLQTLEAGKFYIPACWSPDEQWFVLMEYPNPQSKVFLQKAGDSDPTPLPMKDSDHWVSVFGWAGLGESR